MVPVLCHLSGVNMPRKPCNPPASNENLEKLIELVRENQCLHGASHKDDMDAAMSVETDVLALLL